MITATGLTLKLEAEPVDGFVWIKVDPGTARDLAAAWSHAHATGHVTLAERTRWHDDVVKMHCAAADAEAGRAAARIVHGPIVDRVVVAMIHVTSLVQVTADLVAGVANVVRRWGR